MPNWNPKEEVPILGLADLRSNATRRCSLAAERRAIQPSDTNSKSPNIHNFQDVTFMNRMNFFRYVIIYQAETYLESVEANYNIK
jgi:hypothetical protein